MKVALLATGSDDGSVSPCVCVARNWSNWGSGYQKLKWDYRSEGLSVRAVCNCRQCGCARQHVIASEGQAEPINK